MNLRHPSVGGQWFRSWLSDCIYSSSDLLSYDTPVWEVSGSGPGCQSGYIRVVTYEATTPQCGRLVVQVLVVKLDTGVLTYEAMIPQCGRSVVQVLVVRVDIGVVTYEAMTPQCGRSVVQVLVVRVDTGVVTYEATTPQCGRSVVQVLVVRVIYEW